MVITELAKRRGRRYAVRLDTGEEAMVDSRTFEESPYRVGSLVSEAEWFALLEESEQRRTREKALYLLSMRDHSRAELERKLCSGADRETAAQTAARMEELGLVDDEGYAGRLAEDLLLRRHFSRSHALQELRAKGIERQMAEDAVARVDAQDEDQALALLRGKLRSRRRQPDGEKKAAASLARLGFGYDAIRRALQRMNDEFEEQGMDD